MSKEQMLATLGAPQYLERKVMNTTAKIHGLTAIIEIWFGETTSSVVLVFPSGPHCLIASGAAWRLVKPPAADPGLGDKTGG